MRGRASAEPEMGAYPLHRMTPHGADVPRCRILERGCISATPAIGDHGFNMAEDKTPPKNHEGVPESLWKPHKSKELEILYRNCIPQKKFSSEFFFRCRKKKVFFSDIFFEKIEIFKKNENFR